MPIARRLLLTAAFLISLSSLSVAENWPQFRGPQTNGVPTAKRLPSEWSNDHNIAWKVELPGIGWSQPIVWGNRIFVTTAVTENQPKPIGGAGGERGER